MFRTALVLFLLAPSAAFACGMKKPVALELASAFEDIDKAEEAKVADAEPVADEVQEAATADAAKDNSEATKATSEAKPSEAMPERQPAS